MNSRLLSPVDPPIVLVLVLVVVFDQRTFFVRGGLNIPTADPRFYPSNGKSSITRTSTIEETLVLLLY
ncbi:MAG: hypothetical protein QOI53_1553 [Verrucomicrobiota bacterium]|jgi:hypothetical protein|nr:hypothetical protein [Verrucomicrobiota bacterium]